MAERLITMSEAAKRLSIDRKTLRRLLPKLKAKGLQVGRITERSNYKVREATLDKIIVNAVEKEVPLVSVGPSGIGGPYQKEI